MVGLAVGRVVSKGPSCIKNLQSSASIRWQSVSEHLVTKTSRPDRSRFPCTATTRKRALRNALILSRFFGITTSGRFTCHNEITWKVRFWEPIGAQNFYILEEMWCLESCFFWYTRPSWKVSLKLKAPCPESIFWVSFKQNEIQNKKNTYIYIYIFWTPIWKKNKRQAWIHLFP